jgi:16S rRNA (cytosine967-C5)-methyltransferase
MLTAFSESGFGPAMRRLALLSIAEITGVEAIAGLEAGEAEWLKRVAPIDRQLATGSAHQHASMAVG